MARARLPLLHGLALLTTAAHLVAAAAHVVLHLGRGHGIPGFAPLFALAPFVGLALLLRDRPRHGAILLAFTMAAATWHTLYVHHWTGADPIVATPDALAVRMMLAFELQGAVLGVLLAIRPASAR